MSGPILGMILFLFSFTPHDEEIALRWCAEKRPGAELRLYDVQLPGPGNTTIPAKQAVCFAPIKDDD